MDMDNQEVNPFDPANFKVSSPLNDKEGLVIDADFIRHNYGGATTDEHTALKAVVRAEGLDKDRFLLLGCDPLFPAVRLPDGKLDKAVVGPFLVGGSVDKGSNFGEFQQHLAASGFPINEFAAKGAKALVGALIRWKAVEKTIGKGKDRKVKVYDMPGTFIDFREVPETELTGETSAPVENVPASTDELKAQVAAAVIAMVEANGEIPRAQLAIKVGPAFNGNPRKAEALAMMLKDEFLSAIPGIAYDKKKVSKA